MPRPEDWTEPVNGRERAKDGRDLSYDDEIAHEFFMRHQNRLDAQDRAFEKTGRDWRRTALFDERRVRALQRPRTGQVEVQPRQVPIDEAA